MITGDHPLTAARIASDLGIIETDRNGSAAGADDLSGKVLTGVQLDELPDERASTTPPAKYPCTRALRRNTS